MVGEGSSFFAGQVLEGVECRPALVGAPRGRRLYTIGGGLVHCQIARINFAPHRLVGFVADRVGRKLDENFLPEDVGDVERGFGEDFGGHGGIGQPDGAAEGVDGADAGEIEGGFEAPAEEQFGAEALDVEVVVERSGGHGVAGREVEHFGWQFADELLAFVGERGQIDDKTVGHAGNIGGNGGGKRPKTGAAGLERRVGQGMVPAVTGDLPPQVLLGAYAQGVFPMAQDGEILWFSPLHRGLLPLGSGFRVPHGLRRTLRKQPFEVRWDTAFEAVMRACAERPETWIDERIVRSYVRLHHLGFAHSVECWDGAGLQGGLYGVAMGRAFFGESMFSRKPDASKVALVALVAELRARGFLLLDTQWMTEHLRQFGGTEVSREEYAALLASALGKTPWQAPLLGPYAGQGHGPQAG